MSEVELATGPQGEVEVDSNTEPGLSWDISVESVPLGRGWDAEPCVIDWAGRGVADLVVSSRGGQSDRVARLYLRVVSDDPDARLLYQPGVHLTALDGLRCLCPIPNGGTSRFDLVALSRAGLVHLPNEGNTDEPVFGPRLDLDLGPELGLGACRIVQMTAVDWDSDGVIDLLVGVNDMSDYWPDAGRLPREQQVGLNQQAGHPGFDPAGRWRGRPPVGRIFWLRNVGRPGEPRFEPRQEIQGDSGPIDIEIHPAPLAVSWGGRGSLELLISDHRGLLRSYRNFGGQMPPVLMEPRTLQSRGKDLVLPDDRTTIMAADIDGDGRSELIYGTSDGRVFAVHAGTNRNEAEPPVVLVQRPESMTLAGASAFHVADLDADGDLDIVYGDPAGRIHWLEDRGQGDDHRYASPVPLEAGGMQFRVVPGPDGMLEGPVGHELGFARPVVADWAGHDRPDLIVTGAGGDVLLLPNDGARDDPRFGVPMPIRCGNGPLILPPRVQPGVASWSDPEKPDLIALDLQGFLCTYAREGRHEVSRPQPIVDHLGRLIRLDGGFGLSGGCSIWAGPWTRPDKVDLLVGLPRYNRHVISAVAGLPLEDLDRLPNVLLLENIGDGVVVPRPLSLQSGRPLLVGQAGCCICGVPRSGRELPDLLVGSDDGTLTWISREDLGW